MKSQDVLTIDGERVSAAEYVLVMERQKAAVYGYFKTHKNLDDHAGYWMADTGPESPIAVLRSLTSSELTKIKVQQGFAKRKNLINNTSFEAFRAEFAKENARRTKASQTGEVIYGPRQYRESSYYYIRQGELLHRSMRLFAEENESTISDGQIESFYEANKGDFAGKPLPEMRERIRQVLLEKEFEAVLQRLYRSAKVEVNESVLLQLVPRKDDIPGRSAAATAAP